MVELKEGMDVSRLRFRGKRRNEKRKILAVFTHGSVEYPFAVIYRKNSYIRYDLYTKNGFYFLSGRKYQSDIIEVDNA